MSDEGKFCKDCKHVQRYWMFPWESEFYKCKCNFTVPNPLNGKVKYMSCHINRSDNNNANCGVEAELFERKEHWWMI